MQLMESHLTTLTPPCLGKFPDFVSRQGVYDGDDDDGSDSDSEVVVSPRQKKLRPQGKMDHLHVSNDSHKLLAFLISVCRWPSMFIFNRRMSFRLDPKASFLLQLQSALCTHLSRMVPHPHYWRILHWIGIAVHCHCHIGMWKPSLFSCLISTTTLKVVHTRTLCLMSKP